MKVHDKIVELRSNCNLFARLALMQKQRDNNMKVVGEHELTIVPPSLFNVNGSLLDVAENKSEAVTEVLNVARSLRKCHVILMCSYRLYAVSK